MSLQESELIDEFRHRGVWRGNELYLAPPDALDFVDAVNKRAIRIIGIECFEQSANNLCARLDLIADFSDATLQLANDSAVAFIESVPNNVVCSITIAAET